MPTFLLSHRHPPAECAWVFAAWRGFDSPLRHGRVLSSCLAGDHGLWWIVEARDESAALEQLPECVSRRTEVIRVRHVPVP